MVKNAGAGRNHKEEKMKKLLVALALGVGSAQAMPTYVANPPVPAQHVHVHYDHFDRNTYILGGIMLGLTVGVVVWALTDRYVDPTHYSVQF